MLRNTGELFSLKLQLLSGFSLGGVAMQKLTLEYVKDKIEEVGYKLLSDEYVDNRTKLTILCDKGHEYTVTWNNFKSGKRCPYCIGRHKTIGEIKKFVSTSAKGYVCLSDKYINNSEKLKFKCDKGHEYSATLANFQQGRRCSVCGILKVSGAKRFTIDYIKKETKRIAMGYTCISTEYNNANSKIKFKCDKGHEYDATWAHFINGRRCPTCFGRGKTITDIKKLVMKLAKGYECLSEEYVNAHTPLLLKCDKGHEYTVTWNNFQQGNRCIECAGLKALTPKEMKSKFKEIAPEYKCLSTVYVNTKTKIKVECDKGHKYSTTWNNFVAGKRCRVCVNANKIIYTSEVALQSINYYRACVDRLSNENYTKYFYQINSEKLPRSFTEYHLDHIYTVIDGFNNGILPEIIASPINLQMLTQHENVVKNGRSDMTKEELFKKYNEFIKGEKTNE